MIAALFCSWAIALMLAWALTRRRDDYRPIAWLLSVGFGADTLYQLMSMVDYGTDIFGAWGASVAANVLALAWPTALVAAALRVYLCRGPVPALAGAGVALVGLAFGPPQVSARGVPLILTAVQVLAATGAASLASTWYRNAWRERQEPTPAHFILTMVVLTEVVSLLGAWRIGPREHWGVSQVLYLTMLGLVSVVEGGYLCSPKSSMP
jgi:hypothetical protein